MENVIAIRLVKYKIVNNRIVEIIVADIDGHKRR